MVLASDSDLHTQENVVKMLEYIKGKALFANFRLYDTLVDLLFKESLCISRARSFAHYKMHIN